jgi:hypothetical protein
MRYLIAALVILHVLPGAFWFGATGVLANLGSQGASLNPRKTQTGAGSATVILGLALWFILRQALVGRSGMCLGIVAVGALWALIIQQAVAWPAATRASERGLERFALAQRTSAGLLVETGPLCWRR